MSETNSTDGKTGLRFVRQERFVMCQTERELRTEISDLKRTVLRLIACLAVELAAATAKSLIAEINVSDKDT